VKNQVVDVRTEAIRSVIFVFVLLAVAEIVAPFFHLSFSDPFSLATFVTMSLGAVIRTVKPASDVPQVSILVVKDSYFTEFCEKLQGLPIKQIAVAKDVEEAIQTIDISKPEGVAAKLKKLVKP